MTTHDQEYFEELEIEHDFKTYFANGYVEYTTTHCIGGDYEGYDFEVVSTRELSDITISALWYNDEETGNSVDMLFQNEYREIEEIAEEVIRYEFE